MAYQHHGNCGSSKITGNSLLSARRRRKNNSFGGFYLTKWAPQAKFLRFENATNGIVPYKMSATHETFAI